MKNNTYLKADKLFKSVKNFIICGIDENGYPTAKAVLPAMIRKTLDEIYFVTNTDSKYVRQVAKNNKTSVYFFDPDLYEGCLLKGEMEIIDDFRIKEKLWTDSYKPAYPNPDMKYRDPDFCVLKFESFTGRYYGMFKHYDFIIKDV